MGATLALNAGTVMDKPESRPGESIPTGTHAVDCQALANDLEQARAEAKRERRDTSFSATSVSVLEECADELEDRGLKTR
ncbi:hypothetical protein [Actinacidiphila glaucinigra]|nr:hypothetical protein [Actinacidiphila glaucinigra]